ncbi:hypothetical protein CSC94_16020 [Zhengella mangrovi]|uniref:Uncharacterized protein n=1 Tax=Zhengella mangrovi TaxID=1982044 RepID=A0A2G1QKW2_9HYPH|nr:hypothetical protein [Zhengella mangrovi]PHP66104.1 hypothetical protein CSC94_16020 [Zhengella mangrovi]
MKTLLITATCLLLAIAGARAEGLRLYTSNYAPNVIQRLGAAGVTAGIDRTRTFSILPGWRHGAGMARPGRQPAGNYAANVLEDSIRSGR